MNKWFGSVLKAIKNFIEGIAESISKYGRSAVFCGVFVTILMLLMLAFVEKWMRTEVTRYVSKYQTESITAHRQSFTKSREFYSNLKTYMKQQRVILGCDYMFLIEFHNGNENAITNIQFCKFDITMEVQDQTMPYAYTDDIINENIFKYDLLLSDRVAENKIDVMSAEEMMVIDQRFYNLIASCDSNVNKIIIGRLDYKGDAMGMLVMLFNNDIIPMTEVVNCTNHIEQIFTKNADNEIAKIEK